MSDDASKRTPIVSVINELQAEFRALQAKYAAACDRIVAQSNLLSRAAERAKPAPELARLLAAVKVFGDQYRGVHPPDTALLWLAAVSVANTQITLDAKETQASITIMLSARRCRSNPR